MSNRQSKSQIDQSEPIQKALIQQSIHGVSILQDDVHKFVNKAMESITGYRTDELIGMPYLDIVALSNRSSCRERKRQQFAGNVSSYSEELKFICKDGTSKDVRVYNVITEYEGRPAVISVVQDISALKKAELALRESERRFRAFMDNFPGIVFMRDTMGNYLYTNTEFEALVREAPTKKAKHSRVLQQFYARANQLDHLAWTKSRTIRMVERLPRNNHMLYWLIYRFPITDDTGKITTIGGIGMDITNRRFMEIELKKSRERLSSLVANLHKVREDLAAQVAQEIHDELGQMLTAMKFDIAWLEKKIPKDSRAIRRKFMTLSNAVDEAIHSVGKIASELRPRLLDELGITSAIKWYAKEFEERTEIKCKLLLEPEEIFLDQTTSTVIFRILQEALTNIARHSRANNVKINLEKSNEKLVFMIVDNGIGITDEQINRANAFGLMGIRERANSIGGVARIVGTHNQGTRIVVTIPIA